MASHGYPFSAIVGQPELKLALLLAGVDWRLSVLLKGDKGSGKSTAARALADILPPGAPFVNLPIGATEDRLLGGLDLDQALQGQARLKKGLVHQAHGGILYVDEVNLLADSLTDALLDVASSGRHLVERDGFSVSNEARFVLLGSMNIEEGSLRPQLLDRFALSVDVEAPIGAEDRARIVDARLRFDSDPAGFAAASESEQAHLREAIAAARHLLPLPQPPLDLIGKISLAVTGAGVRSLRADLGILRAAAAHAALDGRTQIDDRDIETVLPLVLGHRAKRNPSERPNPQRDPNPSSRENQQEGTPPASSGDRVFPADSREAPEMRAVGLAASISRGRKAADAPRGEVIGRANEAGLNVVASFTQSFRNTGTASLQSDQLVFRKVDATSGVRFIFVVDSSGSQGAQQRMRAVKGAVAALLASSADTHDEVALVAFRGPKAEIVLSPSRDVEAAMRVLEFLPTGGRTPLAHALDLANSLVNPGSVLILMTDGRANVPHNGSDPWADAVGEARKLKCSSVIVDSSIGGSASEALAELGLAMRARLIRLDELSGSEVFRLGG